ncbi:MAG: rRNA maturation RNase YbeY [Omnitrophica bacterium RIFCSPLOWO2_12_FULL_50_11]|nr:MAG: rRNA maturation RNase YbeY [Omnitrophica bacterium RIFCSPLOWO2_12_FULL_50_11]
MTGKPDAAEALNQVVVTKHNPCQRIRKKNVAALAQLFLKKLGYSKILVSIVFVSDHEMKRLNQRYLNHPWSTDVLAFPLDDPRLAIDTVSRRRRMGRTVFLGEIFISPRRARVQAKHLKVSMSEELARYVCHGILHLSGYSDHTRYGEQRMRRAEDQLLRLVPANTRRIV